jgi:predicted helicase
MFPECSLQVRDSSGDRIVCSMDDLTVYGPLFHKLAYSLAERRGLVKPLMLVRADWLTEYEDMREKEVNVP